MALFWVRKVALILASVGTSQNLTGTGIYGRGIFSNVGHGH